MCGRKLKYMAARRRFKEALRPYDVKDVIGTAQHISTKIHSNTYINHISGSLVTITTFLAKFWWNLQELLMMLNVEFHFIALFLKWIETKILPFKDF